MESRLLINNSLLKLSEPQKIIYLSENIYPETSLNTIVSISKLGEQDNLTILKSVIKEVIKENPGLHIKIRIKNHVPYQFIDMEENPSLEVLDFRGKDVNEEKMWKDRCIKAHMHLIDSVLYKITLYYNVDGDLNLMLQSHHIISDAWSHQSLTTQIYNKYVLIESGEENTFKEKGSYLEYIKTEEDYKKSKRASSSRDFWVSKLGKYTHLPTFLNGKKTNSVIAKQYHAEFNHDIQGKILKICESNKIGFSTFFFACLLITLKKIKNSNTHFLGTLTYNRLGKKEKDVIGMFVNTLPLIFSLKDQYSFKDIVKIIDLEMAGLLRNQRYPLREITYDKELKHLNIASSIDIIYTYQNVILPYDYIYHFCGCSSYPILFRPTRRGEDGEFFLDIDYQIDHFEREDITKIADNFVNVIDELDDIDAPIQTESEIMHIDNINQSDYNYNGCLHHIFESKVEEYAEKVAVTCCDESLTYYDLNRKANYLASKIVSEGLGVETPVVLLMERSVDMMIAILAVLKAGCCYLPLSPEQPINRSKKIIELSESPLVLFNHDIGKSLDSDISSLDVREIKYPIIDIPNLDIAVKPDNLAYIIYTSGSTGEPKGVMLEHKAVMNRLYWMQEKYPIGCEDTLLQKTPYTFDVSVWELFWWYFNGASLHFLKPGGEKEPDVITDVIEKYGVSVIHFVPSMLSLFLEYLDRKNRAPEIKGLKRIICSGEALSVNHVERFHRLLHIPNRTTIHNLYGPTEAAVDVTYYDCFGGEKDFVPIGKPISNVELYVLDKDENVLPAGVEGELFISGVCLARGYFKRDDLTADKFVYNEGLGKRLYSSGDLATYLEDGNIKYLGRIDSQVKIRGNRVELEEIENLILSYEGISEAAVTAPVDDYGNTYLGAYLVADSVIGHEDLRHFIQDQLPSYMVPSFFEQLDEFPLSSSGKLDRKALVVPVNNKDKDKKYRAPVNDREEWICEIWEDVLKREKISIDDNFFEIGGDSLNLIQVLFPLQEKYDLSLQDLFEYPTIESLSRHIHRRNDNGLSFDEDAYNRISKQWKCNNKIGNYMAGIPGQYDLKKVKHERILITGATGFLGIYLTREYLEHSDCEIVLMVRADSIDSAYERVLEKFNYYFDQKLLFDNDDRISVVPGDISHDYFGQLDSIYSQLAKSVDAVIHCAANVKHFGERERIYQSNVMGTKRILDFCKEGREKSIYFVSTTSIGLNRLDDDIVFHFTEDDIMTTNGEGNVYIDSKILAEDLVRSFLVSGSGQILRVGNIVTDLDNKQFQENNEENAFHNLMHDYKNRGIIPDIDIPFIDLTWVNELARAMFLLTTTDYSGVLHLFNPDRVTLKRLFEQLDMKLISMGTFLSELKRNDPILTHGYYLGDIKLLGMIPYSARTLRLLDGLNFKWTPISEPEIGKLWESYANYAVLV